MRLKTCTKPVKRQPMAKIVDYAAVQAEIARQLALTDYDIQEYLGEDLTVLAVLNIYMTNDVCQGFGQDFHNGWSIITSKERISLIYGKKASNYKNDSAICQYDDLSDDVHEILMLIQTVIDRMDL